jgi:hypothetical protein
MSIKIGNKNIEKIFQGTKELREVILGSNRFFIMRTEAPSLAFVSRTQTSVTLEITNNDPEDLTDIEIRYGSTSFIEDSLSISPTNSQEFTITGLTTDTGFNFIATGKAGDKRTSNDSNTVQQNTLAIATVDGTLSSRTATTLNFTFLNNNSVPVNVRNSFTAGSTASSVDENSNILIENLGAGLSGTATFSSLAAASTHTLG